MPRLSVWFIRMALIYLLLGFSFGGLLLAHKGLGYMPAAWMLLPVHIEFLLFGWTLQLAAGMAYWILPRFGRGAPRGDARPANVAFFALNSGIALVVAQPLFAQPWMSTLGRGLELVAAALFAVAIWSRVKPFAT